jgi:hypothetical protein
MGLKRGKATPGELVDDDYLDDLPIRQFTK